MLTRDDEAIDDATPWILMSMEGSGRTGPWTVIIDRQGRYVWAVETGGGFWTMHVQPSYDGSHILIDRNSFWGMFDGGDASNVVRVTIDGEVVSTTDTPGLHHPFTELPDGTLAWGAAQGFFAGDETLKTVAPDGTRNTLWSCEDWLLSIGESVSCGSNTLRWDALTDTFLFSLYTVETVVEIDAKTGNANRWFGHVNGSWGFDPEESAFWWQHGGYYTDARTFLTSSKNVDGGDETVIREYTLDEEREMLVEVWNFGLGEGVYGATMGEAHRLPGGNTLHNYGREVRLREATPEGEVVWDIRWPSASDEIGRSPLQSLRLRLGLSGASSHPPQRLRGLGPTSSHGVRGLDPPDHLALWGDLLHAPYIGPHDQPIAAGQSAGVPQKPDAQTVRLGIRPDLFGHAVGERVLHHPATARLVVVAVVKDQGAVLPRLREVSVVKGEPVEHHVRARPADAPLKRACCAVDDQDLVEVAGQHPPHVLDRSPHQRVAVRPLVVARKILLPQRVAARNAWVARVVFEHREGDGRLALR